MVPKTYHSKTELLKTIHRFLSDKDRGISIKLFAELCGIDQKYIERVFLLQTHPLSEYVQRRVSKGWDEWRGGHVAIMKNQDNTKFVQYRKTPKSLAMRGYGLQVVGGEIKLKLGIKNRADYSDTLADQLGD